jgi:hypothetical protein
LRLVVSHDGHDGSLAIRQDTSIYAGLLEPAAKVGLPLAAGRHAWVQVTRGRVSVLGQTLAAGDGAAISDESHVELAAQQEAEVLLFDLA